jgi:hypothetical protein
MRLWASAKFAGLEIRLKSKNSPRGRRLENLDDMVWLRNESRREKGRRDISVSIGTLMRAMTGNV